MTSKQTTGDKAIPVRWYGWQTLAVDAGSIGVTLLTKGATGSTTAAAAVFLAGYTLGGPSVHLAHGNPGRAGGSFALRLALPVLGGLIGSGADHCQFDCSGGLYAVAGVLVGYAGAVAIDAGLIAREPLTPPTRVVPTVHVSAHRATIGVALIL